VELSVDAAKNLAFEMSRSTDNLFLVLASENDGKANLTVMLSENLVKEKGLNAATIIRELARRYRGAVAVSHILQLQAAGILPESQLPWQRQKRF